MLDRTSKEVGSTDYAEQRQSRHNLKNQQWKSNIMKVISITIVLVTLAVVSVSDGQINLYNHT